MLPHVEPGRLRPALIFATFAALLAAALPAHAAPWAGNRNSFASPRFEQVWRAADLQVQQGRASRSWTWGPQPWFDYKEVYKQSPNGLRQVQYFDKARMEINDPANTGGSLGGVTNGLLVVEMVSGRLKLGEGTGPEENQQRTPAGLPVAGDLYSASATPNPATPSYADFRTRATTDNGYRDPSKIGQRVGETLARAGQNPNPTTGFRQELANLPGVDIVAYESVTGHNVPRVFNDFRNAGPIPAIVAFGYPISDAYWITARVAGQDRDVLVQLFERRTLTYTPSNPPAFRVEMGNAGQHYFQWRYAQLGAPWASRDLALPITFASKRNSADFKLFTMEATGNNQTALGGGEFGMLPWSIRRSWDINFASVWGDSNQVTGNRDLLEQGFVGGGPTGANVQPSNADDYQPAVSPDSTQVAFVSERDGNAELYLVDITPRFTNRIIRLTDTAGCSNGHPSWLPDGSGLVYESNCQGGSWELYRANLSYTLEGNALLTVAKLISPKPGEAERLTNNAADDRWPRVSPDGAQIAFFSNRDGNSEIYTMSIDGSRQTRLTNNPAADEGPTWSPDGTKLAFNSNRDGDHEIFVMNRDGSGQTQLTTNATDDGFAVWGP